jgi:CheY-like chemotaxis protein
LTTVLVCDDETVLRALVRAMLERLDCDIVEACDGHEALEQARRHHPAVILLDMMMPGRSGLSVLAELRADPELSGTFVVMLTARTQLADREGAIAAGADCYMSKPFSPLELARIVEPVLKRAA